MCSNENVAMCAGNNMAIGKLGEITSRLLLLLVKKYSMIL